ncbi:hypothetical protein ABID82_003994 [Methylobacterium sp. PvP062]|uniref:Uncharacterized protein n=1 Tax=Methylobacterium radiotolerans TaxID=31998 RepID=A0ABV2NG88_9HYPH|nr:MULTISPECIES: hypothetical protein [unclassified Methylobacterium]MBP2497789.1 hypothetical protein [Methylobacterium sp. PvP105]MBP2502340.1 hypothetical protein [Methylobacterium sp. PvP109]MCX7335098.1 hypothetical protein [Hyphomicrobiales bacterium]
MRKPNTAKAAPEAQDLRQRAAQARDAAGRFIRRRSPVEPSPDHTAQVQHAALTGDVLAACGIDHRDGTVSYADATGKVVRRPMAHWVAFTAQQMHTHVRQEMGRRLVVEAGDLTAEEHAAWEARLRRELRSDAVHALTFRHDQAFEAAQALRTGAEPAAPAPREQGATEVRLLARGLKAAVDFADASVEELAVIHEKMRHLSDVTYAMAWQGCCQLDTARSTEGSHNVAGRLLQWLGEALTDVERRAADELQRRRPDRPWDRRIRLAAIAAGVIENGDTTETATFIAELATFAVEQAGR